MTNDQRANAEAILARCDGDAELLEKLAEVFLRECPRQMSAVQEAVERGDASALRGAAHKLRGSLSVFGDEAARRWRPSSKRRGVRKTSPRSRPCGSGSRARSADCRTPSDSPPRDHRYPSSPWPARAAVRRVPTSPCSPHHDRPGVGSLRMIDADLQRVCRTALKPVSQPGVLIGATVVICCSIPQATVGVFEEHHE